MGRYDFFFITISFIFGVLCSVLYSITVRREYIFFLVVVMILLHRLPYKFFFQLLNLFNIYFIFFLLGAYICTGEYSFVCEEELKDVKSYYVMSLCTKDLSKKWNRIETLFICYHAEDGVIKKPRVKVKIQLFLYKNEGIRDIQYGDILRVNSTPKDIAPAGEYVAYKKKLIADGIFFQDFVYPKSVSYLCNEPVNRLACWFSVLNFKLNRRLRTFIKNTDDASLASAIILGRKEGSDSNILRAYNKAGVSHFIAISGLHINFLLVIINILLSLFLRSNRGCMKLIRRIITLILLWFYTALIGAPPSALRATTMTSFFILFNSSGRKRVLLRQTFISLFVLVLFSPRILFSIGAQLSYCAMFGISLIYFNVIRWFKFRIPILRYILTTIILSFSIHIFTLPLLFYYFRQISSYSLLSNLFIVPFGVVIYALGLLTIVTSFLNDYINHIVAFFFALLLRFVNCFIVYVSELPGSVIYF